MTYIVSGGALNSTHSRSLHEISQHFSHDDEDNSDLVLPKSYGS